MNATGNSVQTTVDLIRKLSTMLHREIHVDDDGGDLKLLDRAVLPPLNDALTALQDIAHEKPDFIELFAKASGVTGFIDNLNALFALKDDKSLTPDEKAAAVEGIGKNLTQLSNAWDLGMYEYKTKPDAKGNTALILYHFEETNANGTMGVAMRVAAALGRDDEYQPFVPFQDSVISSYATRAEFEKFVFETLGYDDDSEVHANVAPPPADHSRARRATKLDPLVQALSAFDVREGSLFNQATPSPRPYDISTQIAPSR
ncbi:hypothetical protein ACPWR0_07610 [Pandoraea pneumonica]